MVEELLLLLTDDHLPAFLIVRDLVADPELGKRCSAHDKNDHPWHILLVGGLLFVFAVPASVTAAGNRMRR